MKLLSLKIGKMKGSFRSLTSGFEINFHSIDKHDSIFSFNPFCFAGLNGSGKSNVLEALSSIFYHLEFCVAHFRPLSFEKYFEFEHSAPESFQLEYLIVNKGYERESENFDNWTKVKIVKEEDKSPIVYLIPYPFEKNAKKISINNELNEEDRKLIKLHLPDHVIAYSSGENEILSLPFRKCRLVHLDEYIYSIQSKYEEYKEPENSLIYIDNNMSQAVLLACLLFENEQTLKPITDEVGIKDIHSFRMNINLHQFDFQKDKMEKEDKEDSDTKEKDNVLKLLSNNQIELLKKCATCWYIDDNYLLLDFFVTPATKEAFRYHFNSPFELFQVFRILYELNAYSLKEDVKEEVYMSKGFYTDGKLPLPAPDEDIFHFLDFKILKEIKNTGEIKPLLLREFSDGEHQFLHTMGICLLMKNRRTLLLLDEPETHFNPSWRAKFVKMLADSIEAGKGDTGEVHSLKDIILTSHSPFIISDCMPNNVIFFKRNGDTKITEAKNAKELGINTYGASVDFILRNFFNTNLIPNKSYTELRDIIDKGNLDELQNAINKFGESYEKQFLFKKIYEKMKGLEDDSFN